MKLALLISFLIITACDSPIKNKVIPVQQEKGLTTGSFESQGLSFETQWLEGPFGTVSKTSTLLVTVRNQAGQLESLPDTLALSFYATMPAMGGHPMDNEGQFVELDIGVYINRTIRFNMRGDWQMELWLQNQSFNIEDRWLWPESF